MIDLAEPATFGVELTRNVPLAPLTTIKVGGPAEYFASTGNLDQLIALVRWSRAQGLPYMVLGGGSNMLISDAGIAGLVIHNRCRATNVVAESQESSLLTAESGAPMAGVARTSVRAGLAGLEWGVSVPGTIGGAVVGNAGAHGAEVKDSLVSASILATDGSVEDRSVAEFDYAYRSSLLKRQRLLQAGFGPVVLSATFRLSVGDPTEIRQRADRFLAQRRASQPVEPSLGSTFMNPPGDYAGRLIEAAGLKGKRIGGIEVSRTHANFLVNSEGVSSATATDVLKLITLIQDEVKEKSGIQLEREVQLAGAW